MKGASDIEQEDFIKEATIGLGKVLDEFQDYQRRSITIILDQMVRLWNDIENRKVAELIEAHWNSQAKP